MSTFFLFLIGVEQTGDSDELESDGTSTGASIRGRLRGDRIAELLLGDTGLMSWDREGVLGTLIVYDMVSQGICQDVSYLTWLIYMRTSVTEGGPPGHGGVLSQLQVQYSTGT
jgi:hypothetical protein